MQCLNNGEPVPTHLGVWKNQVQNKKINLMKTNKWSKLPLFCIDFLSVHFFNNIFEKEEKIPATVIVKLVQSGSIKKLIQNFYTTEDWVPDSDRSRWFSITAFVFWQFQFCAPVNTGNSHKSWELWLSINQIRPITCISSLLQSLTLDC